MTLQRLDAQSAHRRCFERIAALEAALRAVVEAHDATPWTAFQTTNLAIKQAKKVLNDRD